MARKKIHVSQYTIDKLNQFDYGDLYSVHDGARMDGESEEEG